MKKLPLIILLVLLAGCAAPDNTINTIQPTSTPIPLFATSAPPRTPTITVAPTQDYWNSYIVEYGTGVSVWKAWMPIPRNWDNVGMRAINIIEISPESANLYFDNGETQIAYWEFRESAEREFKVVFEVELSIQDNRINDIDSVGTYDTDSDLYTNNTVSTLAIQSEHPDIIKMAKQIVGDEENPYYQAKLLHNWVAVYIKYGDSTNIIDDALTTLEKRYGGCSNRANLFVAMCRSLGIPARNVAGLHNPAYGEIRSGTEEQGTLYRHVWAEVYIQNHGWIQTDPSPQHAFAVINEERIVLSKGNKIDIGRTGCDVDERSWFHTPETNEWCGGVGPNDSLWLIVKEK